MLQVEHIAKHFGEAGLGGCQSPGQPRGCSHHFKDHQVRENDAFLRCLNHLEKADDGRLRRLAGAYDLAKLSKKRHSRNLKTAFVFFNTTIFCK